MTYQQHARAIQCSKMRLKLRDRMIDHFIAQDTKRGFIAKIALMYGAGTLKLNEMLKETQ